MNNIPSFPVRFNEESLILYFIGLEISNLLKEIKNKSPRATKALPPNTIALTPEQIEEAQQDYCGFVKNAIVVSAKRQEAMNLIGAQLTRANELVWQVDGVIAATLQKPPPVSQEEFDCLNQARLELRTYQDNMVLMEVKLKAIAEVIDKLLAKHAAEWRRHHKKHVDKLEAELKAQQIILSEIEQKELHEPTKTMDELETKLKKIRVIK